MEKLLLGKNITKSFENGGEKFTVLKDISIDIDYGDFVAIIGASGSGKSTLIYALSTMDSIDSGEIIFNGKNLSSIDEDKLSDIRRREMGFVFQQPTLLKNLNILDNIIFPQLRDNQKDLDNLIEKAQNLMEKLGVIDLKDRNITQASGGQLQRIGICRALMNEPKLLFADEPTGALNSKTSEEIMEIFSKINDEGTSILLVTHDVKVAAKANRVLFMKDGKIAGEVKLLKDSVDNVDKLIEKSQEFGI